MIASRLFFSLNFIVLLAFLLGAYLIESFGIKYVSEGGNVFFKIHFFAYLLIIVFSFFCFRYGPTKTLEGISPLQLYWWVAFVCLISTIIYGLLRFGTSGLAYLVVTILPPLLVAPLVGLLTREDKNRILTLLGWLLFLNSLLAILEFVLHSRLITMEFESFSYFRSTAMLGHPLNNALITASLAPLVMNKIRVPPLIFFSVILVSLFAFGGRGATGIYLLGVFLLSINSIKRFFTRGIVIDKRKFALYHFLFLISVFFLMYSLFFTSVGERIFSKLYVDNSAQVRFDVFILLDQLSYSEWMLGADFSLLSNVKDYIGVNVVENYFVGWVLNFGVFFAFFLFISSFFLLAKIFLLGSLNLKISIISFLLISLTNNALATKTPALFIFYMAVFCSFFYKKNDSDAGKD